MDRCNWGTKYVPCTATRLDSAESRPAASSSCDDGWFLKSTGFPNHWSQHIHDFNCFHIFLGGYPVWSQPSTVLNEHILKSTYQQKERIFVGLSDVLSKLSKNKHINILLAVISFPDRFVQKKKYPKWLSYGEDDQPSNLGVPLFQTNPFGLSRLAISWGMYHMIGQSLIQWNPFCS